MKNSSVGTGIFLAVLAAALYAISSPLSKLLLDYMPSTIMAGFLYLGAGIGMGTITLIRRACHIRTAEKRLTKSQFLFVLAMILLDIAAPVCLLFGLKSTTAANASLLNNFEIVATAIIALAVFKERISPRLWLGILFVTLSCALLSFEDISGLKFSYGSLFILAACVCWGFENKLHKENFVQRPASDSSFKGHIFGARFAYNRACHRRTRQRAVERVCRSRRRVRGVRAQHIFLRLRAENAWRGAHKRILCRCSFYRYVAVAYNFQGIASLHLFYSVVAYGCRRVAFFAG